MEKIKKIFESKSLRMVIGVLFIIGVVLFIFEAGVIVGYKSAFFSSHLGDNYYKNFEGGEPDEHVFSNLNPVNLPSANGAAGSILKISLPSIVVADKDGTEKTIIVTDDTIFRQFRNDISSSNLKIGDFIIVVGSPTNTGEIEAKLVRVVPPPPGSTAATTSQSVTNQINK